MKLLEINAVNYGSTGKIMYSLSDIMQERGNEVLCASGFTWHKTANENNLPVGNIVTKSIHMYLSKFFGKHGCYSKISTRKFIKEIQHFSPDVIHLHNIHGWYLNLPLLFDYLKKTNIPVIWTLHDCWAFTGGCAHFTLAKCDKWKTGCGGCPNCKEYPISSKRDCTAEMHRLKQACFCGVERVTVITPSRWLAGLVNQSYLKEYPVKVIHNGIDLGVFKPTDSDFRGRYALENKKIVLGVSFGWGTQKGLDVFIKLSQRLPGEYAIVLVGTDDATDKQLPPGIISIHRTHNQQELAGIYTAADVFVNPTREENYPTVNMEAVACGTPVITFNTGGSPEMLDETCGVVVACDDIDALEREIVRVCETMPFSREACVKKSKAFDMNERFKEYVELYEAVVIAGDKAN